MTIKETIEITEDAVRDLREELDELVPGGSTLVDLLIPGSTFVNERSGQNRISKIVDDVTDFFFW